MRVSRALAVCLVIAGSVFAQSRLVSELRTNYPALTQSFQWYTYDANGHLTYKSVYDGNDSLDPLMSIVRYAYDANNRLTGEATVNTVNDTTGEFRYVYDANGNCIQVRKLNGVGVVNYIDSLEYDANNRLIRMERWNGTGTTLRQFHNLRRDGSGYVLSDTLYEPDGLGGFMATQATLFTNAADGRVLTEAAWLDQGGWSQMHQTRLAYDGNNWLISRTQYQGNGASNTMEDSLGYTNDGLGNRTLEVHYDDTRTLTYRIAYVWEFMVGVAMRSMDLGRELSVEYAGSALRIAGSVAELTVELFDMNGRMVSRQTAPAGALTMPVYARPGSYVARVVSGDVRQTVGFTINR